MKAIKITKWVAILLAVFVSAVLAMPLVATAVWLDQDTTELWVETIGIRWVERITADLKL